MAGVEQVHLSTWIVSAEGLGAGRQEEGIVPAPDRQERRPMAGEVFLKTRIKRGGGRIVTEHIELDLVIDGTGHQRVVEP